MKIFQNLQGNYKSFCLEKMVSVIVWFLPNKKESSLPRLEPVPPLVLGRLAFILSTSSNTTERCSDTEETPRPSRLPRHAQLLVQMTSGSTKVFHEDKCQPSVDRVRELGFTSRRSTSPKPPGKSQPAHRTVSSVCSQGKGDAAGCWAHLGGLHPSPTAGALAKSSPCKVQ